MKEFRRLETKFVLQFCFSFILVVRAPPDARMLRHARNQSEWDYTV